MWLVLLFIIVVAIAILIAVKYNLISIPNVTFIGGNSDIIKEEIEELFTIWERESIIPRDLYIDKPPTIETVNKAIAYYNHGGYYPASDEPIQIGDNIEYPYMRKAIVDGEQREYLQIPYITSRDPKIHREYAKIGNCLLKKFKDNEPLYLSFAGNFGGKDAPMFAALSPIFNNVRRDLWYIKKGITLTPQIPRLEKGLYYSESSPAPIKCSKRVLKPSRIELIIGGNASAGETITIALKTLQIDGTYNVKIIGRKTAGSTTTIGWCTLKHGGQAEYPTGHMTDAWGNDYLDGIYPDYIIENPFI